MKKTKQTSWYSIQLKEFLPPTPVNQSVSHSISQSINQAISQSVNQTISQFVNQRTEQAYSLRARPCGNAADVELACKRRNGAFVFEYLYLKNGDGNNRKRTQQCNPTVHATIVNIK